MGIFVMYYDLEHRDSMFCAPFSITSGIRKLTSTMPISANKAVCDVMAIVVYMPFIIAGPALKMTGINKVASRLPLSYYQNKTVFIIRNNLLDRFCTSLEHRFSKSEVKQMMEKQD